MPSIPVRRAVSPYFMASAPLNAAVPPPPANLTCTVTKLNPIAFPKGAAPTCDLTGKPAEYALVTDYQTLNFASRELAKVAWDGILCKIVHVMGKVLAEASHVGSEDERERRLIAVNAGKLALVALCREEAASHVVRGQFELAIPAAQYALRFSTSVYGDGSVELVPAYLLIAEANLGLARYRQAEEQLTLANWALLKAPHGSNALRSQLRRNFGRLYASQSKFAEALRQLADDVYYSSLMVGPEHIDTSGGYFQLGNVFYSMNKIENALAMYDKVVDIWYKCVTQLLSVESPASLPPLGDAKGAEGIEVLSHIRKRREECVGTSNIATGESNYILGLLYQYLGQLHKAAEHMRIALAIYENQLGSDHQSTKDVTLSLMTIEGAAA